VLIDDDQPDRVQTPVPDPLGDLPGSLALGVAVKAVGRDEARRPHPQAGASTGESVRHVTLLPVTPRGRAEVADNEGGGRPPAESILVVVAGRGWSGPIG
jgi:hypothetical protein